MSEYFSGVTFENQLRTPSDDATLHRAFFPDCILDGCPFSYAGSSLTMGTGSLLICGRQANHIAVQSWSVVDATSGYARLVLTADLTRAATVDSFDQVFPSIEYAASVNGFAQLQQADINKTGSVYQIEACVVSLGSGGITGIVQSLQKAKAISDAERKPIKSVHGVRSGQTITLTFPLEGGGQDVLVVTVDSNDLPTNVNVNGVDKPVVLEGF